MFNVTAENLKKSIFLRLAAVLVHELTLKELVLCAV